MKQKKVGRAYYVYPFTKSATSGRIDQGWDVGGSGPIYAIGRAKILAAHSVWPEYDEGKGILYELLDGPAKGKVVYVYEGVSAHVKAGQEVQAGERIGTIIPGTSTGIETGWALRSGQPISHGEYTEGLETGAGKSFKAFLAGLPHGRRSALSNLTPAERKKIEEVAEHENLGSSIGDVVPGVHTVENAAGDAASAVADGLVGLLSDHAEALMLNVALVGGGAFLVYYGAALLLGVKQPAKPFVNAAQAAAFAPK